MFLLEWWRRWTWWVSSLASWLAVCCRAIARPSSTRLRSCSCCARFVDKLMVVLVAQWGWRQGANVRLPQHLAA